MQHWLGVAKRSSGLEPLRSLSNFSPSSLETNHLPRCPTIGICCLRIVFSLPRPAPRTMQQVRSRTSRARQSYMHAFSGCDHAKCNNQNRTDSAAQLISYRQHDHITDLYCDGMLNSSQKLQLLLDRVSAQATEVLG